jgi:hypothetical protein
MSLAFDMIERRETKLAKLTRKQINKLKKVKIDNFVHGDPSASEWDKLIAN